MVIHYPPERLRSNSDLPSAITDVLVTTTGSPSTGEISLGAPTSSARTRHGRWALYPSGEEVVVVWPGGALTGLPAEVADELNRLAGDRHDDLDRDAVWAIRQFLTDPAAADATRWSSTRLPTMVVWLSVPWPRRVRAEQVGLPSGISPVREDDPEVVTRTLVIAVGWSLLWRSRAGG